MRGTAKERLFKACGLPVIRRSKCIKRYKNWKLYKKMRRRRENITYLYKKSTPLNHLFWIHNRGRSVVSFAETDSIVSLRQKVTWQAIQDREASDLVKLSLPEKLFHLLERAHDWPLLEPTTIDAKTTLGQCIYLDHEKKTAHLLDACVDSQELRIILGKHIVNVKPRLRLNIFENLLLERHALLCSFLKSARRLISILKVSKRKSKKRTREPELDKSHKQPRIEPELPDDMAVEARETGLLMQPVPLVELVQQQDHRDEAVRLGEARPVIPIDKVAFSARREWFNSYPNAKST